MFSWGKSDAPSFGANIAGVDGLPSQLVKVKGDIQQSQEKVRREIEKYKQVVNFNKQLSTAYERNLHVMVDISQVLTYYVEIFNLLRDEFSKSNELMNSSSLKTSDIAYLEKLTKSQIDTLNKRFMEESEKLKKMYTEYGKKDELTRITEAQGNLVKTTTDADTVFENLRRIDQGVPIMAQGGKSKKVKKGKKGIPKYTTWKRAHKAT